jgi:DNA-binding response OmpR family regulator
MTESRGRILCVEDHVDTSNMLAYWLSRSGYEFVPALTYAEGAERVIDDDFDAYIIDNRLPDGRGVDLCKQIRESDRETPIIFYSADAQNQVIKEALDAGATKYLVKPYNIEALEQVISDLLQY